MDIVVAMLWRLNAETVPPPLRRLRGWFLGDGVGGSYVTEAAFTARRHVGDVA